MKHLSSDEQINVVGNHHAYTPESFAQAYQKSIDNPDVFWSEMADRLDWYKKPTIIKNTSFDKDDLRIKWYEDGTLNACYNTVDRHAKATPNAPAITWEGDEVDQQQTFTYDQLKSKVSAFANVLKSLGVKKGNAVTIYMPMIPEAVFAMLACARIGAVHSVVFGGFSAESLASRITNCKSQFVITADVGKRGGKSIAFKTNVDQALNLCPDVKHTLIVNTTGDKSYISNAKDVDYFEALKSVNDDCPCEEINAEDPLFILYTSGSTGTPKGLVHTTGGYLVYAGLTFENTFDYRQGETYWCTADVGWITGHTYLVYGPLSVGGHSVVFEGVPTYPDASRFWQVVDKHKVNIFYTAPTAIRSLLSMGDDYVTKTDRSSLRILGTVGEPINVEAWAWYYEVIGNKKCAIVDTWWQTETGGHMVTPIPYLWNLKPSKASLPSLGVNPVLIDEEGKEIIGVGSGSFCIKGSWPGQARTVFGDHSRFYDTYFKDYKGYYFTGDGAQRDADGYIRITGRMDDVLNVSGHRMGTAEVENALGEDERVAETAIVGFKHPIKGEGIYAFCILKDGATYDSEESFIKELTVLVRKKIGPIATPDFIQITTDLPKTRSGKIMRRILRKIANNDTADMGDISTLADTSVVQTLIDNRKNIK